MEFPTNLAEAAVAFADAIAAGGVPATADAREVGTTPTVLVTPPVRNYPELSSTWTLTCMAGRQSADLVTLEVLADLVERLSEILPIEEARPSLYQISPDRPAVPAYLVRVVTS